VNVAEELGLMVVKVSAAFAMAVALILLLV
jgi:hypothetical protein